MHHFSFWAAALSNSNVTFEYMKVVVGAILAGTCTWAQTPAMLNGTAKTTGPLPTTVATAFPTEQQRKNSVPEPVGAYRRPGGGCLHYRTGPGLRCFQAC